MKNIFINITGSWEKVHWAICIVITVLAGHFLYAEHEGRTRELSTINTTVVEQDIEEFNTMAERLAQLEMLPPVRMQWAYIKAIAEEYGVDLSLSDSKGKLYRGPLASWDGEIKGDMGAILVTAIEMQETVPMYLYDFDVNQNKATIKLAVLGSE